MILATKSREPGRHFLQIKLDFVQHQLDRCTGYENSLVGSRSSNFFTLTSSSTQAKDPV